MANRNRAESVTSHSIQELWEAEIVKLLDGGNYLSENSCCICLIPFEEFDKLATFECIHFVCKKCFDEYRRMGLVKCPMCRKKVEEYVTVSIYRGKWRSFFSKWKLHQRTFTIKRRTAKLITETQKQNVPCETLTVTAADE